MPRDVAGAPDPVGEGSGSLGPGLLVGVDVGGSKVLAGVVDRDGTVLRTTQRETPGRLVAAEAVEDALVEAVRLVAGEDGPAGVAAVGVAAAGFVDAGSSRVVFAPHLPWRDADVRGRLGERLGVPVLVDNDATCAAYAEALHGAGRGASSMVLVTLGTGIGGGLTVRGRVWRGRHGMAGEFGHMQVVPDGEPCECGHHGCWEQYASGNALVRHVRSRLAGGPTVSPRLTELCAGDPGRLSGPMVTTAAEEGDPVARAAFASVGRWLGVGLANLVAALDPEVVVVGGGVAAAGELLLGPAREALAGCLVGAAHRELPTLLPAALGPSAGLVGAALLAVEA